MFVNAPRNGNAYRHILLGLPLVGQMTVANLLLRIRYELCSSERRIGAPVNGAILTQGLGRNKYSSKDLLTRMKQSETLTGSQENGIR